MKREGPENVNSTLSSRHAANVQPVRRCESSWQRKIRAPQKREVYFRRIRFGCILAGVFRLEGCSENGVGKLGSLSLCGTDRWMDDDEMSKCDHGMISHCSPQHNSNMQPCIYSQQCCLENLWPKTTVALSFSTGSPQMPCPMQTLWARGSRTASGY